MSTNEEVCAVTELEREVQVRLFAEQDLAYRAFNIKLIPTVPPERVIGVRTPQLRALAKQLRARSEIETFLRALPHAHFEEDQLHSFLIAPLMDYDQEILELDRFLPYVDNWATCDQLSPAVFRTRPPQLRADCHRWIDSGAPYTVRFGIGQLMRHFLAEDFAPEDLERVAQIRSDEYYVNMMVAWYLATALAEQYDAALPYLTEGRLDRWVHGKTIQKALESRRIPAERKDRLRGLRARS